MTTKRRTPIRRSNPVAKATAPAATPANDDAAKDAAAQNDSAQNTDEPNITIDDDGVQHVEGDDTAKPIDVSPDSTGTTAEYHGGIDVNNDPDGVGQANVDADNAGKVNPNGFDQTSFPDDDDDENPVIRPRGSSKEGEPVDSYILDGYEDKVKPSWFKKAESGDLIIAKKDIHRKLTPPNTARPTYVLYASKGTFFPKDGSAPMEYGG